MEPENHWKNLGVMKRRILCDCHRKVLPVVVRELVRASGPTSVVPQSAAWEVADYLYTAMSRKS